MGQQANLSLFPIPVSVGTFGEASRELNKQLVIDSLDGLATTEVEERSGIHVKQTVSDLEGKYNSFAKLQALVTDYARGVVSWAGTHNSDIKSEFFWCNLNQRRDAFHMPHSHQMDGYLWTGVYFPTSGVLDGKNLSDDEDLDVMVDITSKTQPDPGSLVLQDPLHFVKQGVATKKTDRYPFWGNSICIVPKEGTIVLFPTYLPHLVTPTEKDNFTRLSIAFYVRVHNGNGGIDKF